METKFYDSEASMYAELLKKRGYAVRFNWVSQYGEDGEYEDITVIRHGEFSTPRDAYETLCGRRGV